MLNRQSGSHIHTKTCYSKVLLHLSLRADHIKAADSVERVKQRTMLYQYLGTSKGGLKHVGICTSFSGNAIPAYNPCI
jgi:hypothetical protein